MAGGQPTKYKAEYCAMLIEHMAKGFSFESFASVTNTCDETLDNWVKKYPEFLTAKRQARAKCREYWEYHAGTGKYPPAVWIYNMKCRFRKEWHDTQVVVEKSEQKITQTISPEDQQILKEQTQAISEWLKAKKK